MSQVRSEYVTATKRQDINWRKVAAGVAQLLSYLTTLWAVQWVWSEGELLHQVVVAFILEAILVIMKNSLFTGQGVGVGWAGMAIDAVINAGGLLPRAGRVLTFPPLAAMLSFFGVNAVEASVLSVGGFILAVIGGILLSVLPHRLWRE